MSIVRVPELKAEPWTAPPPVVLLPSLFANCESTMVRFVVPLLAIPTIPLLRDNVQSEKTALTMLEPSAETKAAPAA